MNETKEIYRQQFPGCKALDTLDQMCHFEVPQNVFPSTNGVYCKCEYILDIEADLPMAIDVNFQSPIVIALLPAPNAVGVLPAQYYDTWK